MYVYVVNDVIIHHNNGFVMYLVYVYVWRRNGVACVAWRSVSWQAKNYVCVA